MYFFHNQECYLLILLLITISMVVTIIIEHRMQFR